MLVQIVTMKMLKIRLCWTKLKLIPIMNKEQNDELYFLFIGFICYNLDQEIFYSDERESKLKIKFLK